MALNTAKKKSHSEEKLLQVMKVKSFLLERSEAVFIDVVFEYGLV